VSEENRTVTETFFDVLQGVAGELEVKYSEAHWNYPWPLKKELPEDYDRTFLYHYTSQAGAHGILDSKSIWADDAFFLNDPQEVAWGREALKTAIERLDTSKQAQLKQVLSSLTKVSADDGHQAGGLVRSRAYTVSFSKNEDVLRQWRAYGGSRGVALGFNLKLLAKTQPDALLAPVLYKEQEVLADLFYNDLTTALESDEARQLKPSDRRNHLIERYATLLPLAKSPDYEDEEEWRLVVPGFRVREAVPKWRSGRDYATPYLTLGLWDDKTKGQLDAFQGCHAVMGPEAHPLARQFFDKTLKGRVVTSKIKFRSS